MRTIFQSFTNLIKNVETDEDEKDIGYETIFNSNFVSQLVSSKKKNPVLPIVYEIRNSGKTATGGGQEKTLKTICKLQEQHLT